MIIHEGIEFHNVAELVPEDHPHGLALYRYPREVRSCLSTLGHHAAASADGVEIRFAGASGWVSVTLSARSNYPFSDGARVRIYRGDIFVEEIPIPDGATRSIKLNQPPGFSALRPEAFAGSRFSPDVWRLVFAGATVVFHEVDAGGAAIRPPESGERPRTRWLAYGSSITNSTPGYIEHAAVLLGTDAINKGLSGSCRCEPEVAAYLPGADEWDLATLELGVNMRGEFSAEAFESRARNLVQSFLSVSRDRPVALITIFPNSEDFLAEETTISARQREYREALTRIHQTLAAPNLHLVPGDTILTRFAGLTQDFIHPSAVGHQEMGTNLARVLGDLLAR